MPEIRELDVLALWKRGGKLRAWVCCAITAACAITILSALIGPAATYDGGVRIHGLSRFWFRNGLAILSCVWIALTAVFGSRLSRFVRIAILLPVLHLVVMLVAWCEWTVLRPHVTVSVRPLIALVPIHWLVLGIATACCGGGWLVARRARREWIHATVVMALSLLLLLGLWLPIACSGIRGDAIAIEHYSLVRIVSAHRIALALLPPVFGALVIAAIVIRRPGAFRRLGVTVCGGLGFVWCAAIADRLGASASDCLVYASFMPILLASGLVAIASLIALAYASRQRPLRNASHSGVIAFDDAQTPVVAYVQITSWLRGPQAVVRPFTVTTDAGEIPVPSGAKLAVTLPELTTQLRAGESIEVLRCGDRVVLDGFVTPDPQHPFRGSLAPLAGERGISVGKPDSALSGFEAVALAIWRPCVAYLLIVTAIGVPALAAILTA